MRKTTLLIAATLLGICVTSCNKNETQEQEVNVESETTEHQHEMMMMQKDERVSLNLNPKQKQHQLKNMRSHLSAIQQITQLIATDDYEKASIIAHTKLGLTPEMKQMCSMFGDEKFEKIGLDFHNSADEMGEIFKNRNKQESLKALSNTMNYCVKCHATYSQ